MRQRDRRPMLRCDDFLTRRMLVHYGLHVRPVRADLGARQVRPAVSRRPLEAEVDLKKLSQGEQIMGGAGIVLFIFSFFKWFGKDFSVKGFGSVGSYSQSGWGSFLSLLGILLALVIVVVLVLQKFTTVKLPDLPISWNQAYFFASIAVAALIVLQLLVGTSKGGVDLDRKFGVYIGAIAALAMVAGGFLQSKETAKPTAPPTSF